MVRRNESPIGFHFDGEPVEKDWSPQSTESVWWLPRATASDYLILANASKEPLLGSLVISDSAGHSASQAVTLGPAETKRMDLRAAAAVAHLAGTEGGVTVLVPTGGGNLITSHIVFDERTGMSATMKAFERDPAEKPKAHTMRAPMMALANPDPVLMFPTGTKLVRKFCCGIPPVHHCRLPSRCCGAVLARADRFSCRTWYWRREPRAC
ncbi:MAG: hypothetical protein JO340_05850 [Acidobacteriaceae bacterium]|nr:hypothetical protein [Acidobacteriaceae bacterium]